MENLIRIVEAAERRYSLTTPQTELQTVCLHAAIEIQAELKRCPIPLTLTQTAAIIYKHVHAEML